MDMIALRQTSLGPTFPSLTRAVVDLVDTWRERRRQRRALLDLGPDLLKDIGLDPAEAWYEGTKPFWRA
jgi:uncharacterized protein YjiS (DUF1127 family)